MERTRKGGGLPRCRNPAALRGAKSRASREGDPRAVCQFLPTPRRLRKKQAHVVLLPLEQLADLVDPQPLIKAIVGLVSLEAILFLLLGPPDLLERFPREVLARVLVVRQGLEHRREERRMGRERRDAQFVHRLAGEGIERSHARVGSVVCYRGMQPGQGTCSDSRLARWA
jgi:hypothetical protein